MGTSAIDIKIVPFHVVKLATFDDMLAEVDRLIASERAGTLEPTGNWTLGQTLGHLAGWMSYPYDGYPPDLRPPWFVKLVLRGKKNKFFTAGMPRGVRIPKIEGGTKSTEPLSTEEGAARLRKAAARMKAHAPTIPNPIFGPLTHEEWIGMNLRHAELHLGYMGEK